MRIELTVGEASDQGSSSPSSMRIELTAGEASDRAPAA